MCLHNTTNNYNSRDIINIMIKNVFSLKVCKEMIYCVIQKKDYVFVYIKNNAKKTNGIFVYLFKLNCILLQFMSLLKKKKKWYSNNVIPYFYFGYCSASKDTIYKHQMGDIFYEQKQRISYYKCLLLSATPNSHSKMEEDVTVNHTHRLV